MCTLRTSQVHHEYCANLHCASSTLLFSSTLMKNKTFASWLDTQNTFSDGAALAGSIVNKHVVACVSFGGNVLSNTQVALHSEVKTAISTSSPHAGSTNSWFLVYRPTACSLLYRISHISLTTRKLSQNEKTVSH